MEDNFEDLLIEAKQALVQERFDESIDIFCKILKSDPENLIALFSCGTARLRNKDYKGAVDDFTRYLELNHKNEKVYCSRGNAYIALEQFDAAMNDLNKAIDINPHYPTVYFSRAELFSRLGEETQAEEDKMVGDKLMAEMSKAYYQRQGIAFDKPE